MAGELTNFHKLLKKGQDMVMNPKARSKCTMAPLGYLPQIAVASKDKKLSICVGCRKKGGKKGCIMCFTDAHGQQIFQEKTSKGEQWYESSGGIGVFINAYNVSPYGSNTWPPKDTPFTRSHKNTLTLVPADQETNGKLREISEYVLEQGIKADLKDIVLKTFMSAPTQQDLLPMSMQEFKQLSEQEQMRIRIRVVADRIKDFGSTNNSPPVSQCIQKMSADQFAYYPHLREWDTDEVYVLKVKHTYGGFPMGKDSAEQHNQRFINPQWDPENKFEKFCQTEEAAKWVIRPLPVFDPVVPRALTTLEIPQILTTGTMVVVCWQSNLVTANEKAMTDGDSRPWRGAASDIASATLWRLSATLSRAYVIGQAFPARSGACMEPLMQDDAVDDEEGELMSALMQDEHAAKKRRL